MADTLGVNRSTARGIVARYIREGRIHERLLGGRNNVQVDDEMRDYIEEILNETCLLTLSQRASATTASQTGVSRPDSTENTCTGRDAIPCEVGQTPPSAGTAEHL